MFIWNLPNSLTLLRLVVAVVYLLLALQGEWRTAFWLFVIGGFTDMVDGALARLLRQKTRTGAILDPAADKLLMFFGFLSLLLVGGVPVWFFWLVFLRDLMISAGVLYFCLKKIYIEYRPTLLSKATTLAQIITLVLALGHAAYQWPQRPLSYWITGFLTACSGIQYVGMGLGLLKKNHET